MSEQIANSLQDKPTYILSMDLGEKLESFRRIGINAPGPYDDFTRDIQTEISDVIKEALPEVNIESVYMTDLADDVLGTSSQLTKGFNKPLIVSSCPEIAYPAGGGEIQINRLIDINGSYLGLGPRPGFGAIADQVKLIANRSESEDVIVVEDGIFTGSTIKTIVKEFQKTRMNVRAVVAGFNCKSSDKDWIDQEGYQLLTTRDYAKIHDWVPDHDFIPFVPGSGKVIGVNLGNDKNYPFYDHRQATYSVPYLKGFAPMESWASIPVEATGASTVSFIKIANTLFREIERKNSKQDIRIGDLLASRQHCSVPIQIGDENFVPLESRVTQYLGECL